MDPKGASRQEAAVPLASRARHRPMKALWRRIRKPLAQSRFVKGAVAQLIVGFLRLVYATNPRMKGSSSDEILVTGDTPFIFAMWHGQHLMAPPVCPKGSPLVAMVSRSADAELNALVIEKFGIRTVRGSGGRQDGRQLDKGGAQALIALKKALDLWQSRLHDRRHTPRDAARGGSRHRHARTRLRPAHHSARHRHQPAQGSGKELGQDDHPPAFRAFGGDCGRPHLRAAQGR